MPVDFSAPEGATTPTTEGPIFAPTPLWDRDAKKRRRGAPTAKRQMFTDPAIDAGEAGAGAGVIGATTAAEPLDTVYETQPAGRGVAVAAIAAGVVAVAALGALGWYASQPRGGVAELTPGAPATSQVALNTAAPPSTGLPAPAAIPTPSERATEDGTTTTTRAVTPAAKRHTETSVATRAPAPRVRPAPRPSAMDTGVDASAAAPMVNTPAPSPGRAVTPDAPATMAPPVTAPSGAPPGSIDDSSAPTASAPVNPTATP